MLGDDDALPASGPVIVSLERFNTDQNALLARKDKLGIRLKSGQEPTPIADYLDRLDLVALEFPTYRNGRAYSYARMLRDRFGFSFRLEFYSPTDLESIVMRAATLREVEIDSGGAYEIARRSRGTPRIAIRLLHRVQDYAEVRSHGRVDTESAADGLTLFGIDELGLDKVDRQLLENLCGHFGGGPVGLSTLAISIAEPTETVEDVIEFAESKGFEVGDA